MDRGSAHGPLKDPGLIAFTITEIKRLFLLLNRKIHHVAHHLHGANGDADTKPAPDGPTTAGYTRPITP